MTRLPRWIDLDADQVRDVIHLGLKCLLSRLDAPILGDHRLKTHDSLYRVFSDFVLAESDSVLAFEGEEDWAAGHPGR